MYVLHIMSSIYSLLFLYKFLKDPVSATPFENGEKVAVIRINYALPHGPNLRNAWPVIE